MTRRVEHRGVALVYAALIAAASVLLVPGPAHAEQTACAGEHWVGIWAASPTNAISDFAVDRHDTAQPESRTFRAVVTAHRGGEKLRVRLSNRFGSTPVTFTRATVARQLDGAAVEPQSLRPLLFDGGNESVTLAPGAEIVTDPVSLPFSAFAPLAVSVHLDRAPLEVTGHFEGNATSFLAPLGAGDHARDTAADAFTQTTDHVPFVSQIDAIAPAGVATVVTFGDSITDGHVGSNALGEQQIDGIADRNLRYPDFLQRRLDDSGRGLVVANAGIGGNRLTRDTLPIFPKFGPSGLSRAQADVIGQMGVTDVVVLIGINDLGTPVGVPYEELVAGYTRLIEQFHTAGLRVHLGTLLPASNSLTHGALSIPPAEPVRERVNSWIRTQDLSDTVVDFDAALRDPADPHILDARYASPDNLHPSPAGYEAMAAAVDLAQLAGNPCSVPQPR